jgi:hypothetical protein
LGLSFKSPRLIGEDFLILKDNWDFVSGIEGALTFAAVMFFQATGNIGSNTRIKGIIAALYYI